VEGSKVGKTGSAALIIIVIFSVGLNVFQYYQLKTSTEDHVSPDETYPRLISELKGPERGEFIGKTVTAEGYFVLLANKYPALVSSLDYLMLDMPIPDDRFLELRDVTDEELMTKAGAMVRVTGNILEIEGDVFLEFGLYRVVQEPLLYRQETLEPMTINMTGVEPAHFKYAVLISGGYNQLFAYPRYWNNMKYMYSILVGSYRYSPDNIYVIYKDGIGEDTDMPVNYSATVSNVATVFSLLAAKMTERDTLFVFTTNHGGGFNTTGNYGDRNNGLVDVDGDEPEAGYSEAAYGEDFNKDGDKLDTVKIDEVLNLYYEQSLSDDDLADMLDNIVCRQMIIVMGQCFSGGFIHDLSAPGRIILTACSEEEVAWAENTKLYSEFAHLIMKAVNGVDWSADANGDKNISVAEAFNYACQKDTQPETPQYDDNGDGVGHTKPLPTPWDGTAGLSTFL
jgi:hypothetical protein